LATILVNSRDDQMKRFVAMAVLVVVVLSIGAFTLTSVAEEPIPSNVSRVTKEDLKEQMGKPGVIILDCRPTEQWTASQQKLPGAVHEDPNDVKSWAHKYPKEAKIVIY
jgi:Rhodanese-like domain